MTKSLPVPWYFANSSDLAHAPSRYARIVVDDVRRAAVPASNHRIRGSRRNQAI